jgi:hypothetical protein
MELLSWLLFCSQLPANPSRARVMVWRHLRAAGATGLQNGVWVLPHSPEHEKLAQDLQAYVEQQGGSSQIFTASSFNADIEEHILERFQADRDEEYGEFKEQCDDFLAEIAKEIERANFSYAEFEENEQNLNKLVDWLAKIKRRDFTGQSRAAEAGAMLDNCRQALLEFADQVYRNEGAQTDIDTTNKGQMQPPGGWAPDSINETHTKEI